MKFSPRNRHLLVEKIEKPQNPDTPSILLPEDYKPVVEEHSYVRVRDIAPDCSLNISRGDLALVETHMLNQVEMEEEVSFLILENYILGVLTSR